jgi:hypothetical protein
VTDMFMRFLLGDENVLTLIVMMVVQLYKRAKIHRTVNSNGSVVRYISTKLLK